MSFEIIKYSIAVSEESHIAEKHAAFELSDYIEKITGKKLEIVNKPSDNCIFIGEIARGIIGGEIKHDGYRICERDGNLYVFGSIPRGTLYGVYGLLEYFGCRFLDTDTEVIPDNPELSFEKNFDILDEPAFEYRDLFWGNTYDSDFAAKLRLDGAVYDNGMYGHKYSEKHGGGMSYAGPKFVHTFAYLMPESEFFGEHPEYFSMIDGKRCGEHLKTQPCLTNPDVLRIITDRVLGWLRDDPNAEIVSVSQNDSTIYNSSCNCPACAKINEEEESPAGTLIRFVNKVAEAVEAEFPKVVVDTLAYQYSTTPPKLTKPRHNVAVRMCTGGCYSHPITECSQNEHTQKCIETWGKYCRRQYIWDYTADFAQYLIPLPNFRIFKKNAQFFRDNGVMGVFEQGNYQSERNGEFCELRAYVLSHLLWNPDSDDKKLIDEFISIYYGNGAEYIHKYFDLIHEKTVDVHFNWNPQASELWSCMKDGDIAMLDTWFAEAKKLCADDERSLLHVKRTEISFRFMKIELKAGEYADPDGFDGLRAEFFEDCKKYGISMYNEGAPIDAVK